MAESWECARTHGMSACFSTLQCDCYMLAQLQMQLAVADSFQHLLKADADFSALLLLLVWCCCSNLLPVWCEGGTRQLCWSLMLT